MDSPLITIEQNNSHLIIRLNRQEKSNTLSDEMIVALSDFLTNRESQPNLRAIILTGAGDNAFWDGIDKTEISGFDRFRARELSGRGRALCNQIENCRVPVIAAVNGIVAGGGYELAFACHLIIASVNAQFSLPERNPSETPGKTISADEALRLGWINRVVPAAELQTQAEALAREIAQLAPLAIRACLEAVNRGTQLPLAEGLALEAKLFAELFATEDVREGTRAFLEKRKPVFRGV